ncbi:MAG: TaqI-like C-terminal specificity domain-containing protein, partial [Candidatus Thermoplasmatota archaeon]|nr:TaqI-like C-terminal specificity domain-containing protein [Candidatus Thermoplasmatota archaeon]
SYQYLLGLLNSRLSTFYLKIISSTFRGGYLALNRQYIEKLPIRIINFSDTTDVARHDRMVGLVDRMLALHREREDVRDGHARELIERQIEATDAQIDRLVYELYDLTNEEIRIVEGQ